jgi:magnesium-transporting ATPase (P-type)
MITGDQPATAKAIARDVGIIKNETIDEVAASKGISVEQVDITSIKAVIVHGKGLIQNSIVEAMHKYSVGSVILCFLL